MNREQLTHFSVAYRTHNFASAARQIPMSAQGLTKSLRSLESELGVTLFERDENGENLPTPYASILNDFADSFEHDYRKMQHDFDTLRAEQDKKVILGSSLGIMGFLGKDFQNALRKSCPELSMSYSEMSDYLCDSTLKDGTFKLAFTLAPYDVEFTTVSVYTTPVCLWVKTDNPLSLKDVIEPADLEGCNLAIPGKDFKCYSTILDACEQKGAHPSAVLESSEMFWLYDYARKGEGLAFSAGHLGRLPFFHDDDTVKCIPLKDINWTFGLSTLASHTFSETERRFYRFCLSYFKRGRESL